MAVKGTCHFWRKGGQSKSFHARQKTTLTAIFPPAFVGFRMFAAIITPYFVVFQIVDLADPIISRPPGFLQFLFCFRFALLITMVDRLAAWVKKV